ncbi:hypothetical protein EYF80_013119 [Liparis tanakae]|uniref:Uncharacterized protein n=1 Tax=Liparis tanakae TaxID=230148 RepID=A0A4Z2IFR4_9TELE|nr:hypothetical protein EYF80_013119 [Liparis tanakae]
MAQRTISHLFDAVWVDGGLWLQYADRLGFLGTLGHLADFLRNEVVDTIEGLDCTLCLKGDVTRAGRDVKKGTVHLCRPQQGRQPQNKSYVPSPRSPDITTIGS